jgi:hypothetical protein
VDRAFTEGIEDVNENAQEGATQLASSDVFKNTTTSPLLPSEKLIDVSMRHLIWVAVDDIKKQSVEPTPPL